MKYSNIIDTHTHSNNSFDGNDSCDKLCESIISMGAKGIAITDHVDINGDDYDTDKQYNDAVLSKEKYKDSILVLTGIELGQGIYYKDESDEILNKYNYDFVLGSIHNLKELEDFYYLDYKKYDVYELLDQYFSDMLELVKWNKTDSLAHMSYPLRYIVAREHINVDMSKYDDIIDEIFLELIKNDKALELNTSGLFMDINDTLPNKSYIKRFHDLGGKYVTIGSDSHFASKLCQGFDEGLDVLKECGFSHYTIFKQRKPVLIPIE